MSATTNMQATQKQVDYIKSLQGQLGMSTSYVDVKGILGKHKIGYQLTQANASELISRLLARKRQADMNAVSNQLQTDLNVTMMNQP